MLTQAIVRLMALAALVVVAAAKPQLLVAYDSALYPETSELEKYFPSGHDVSYADYANSDAKLFANGEIAYDHLVLFPTSKRAAAAKDVTNKHSLLEFFNAGGNVIVVGSAKHSVPEDVRSFMNQAGIYAAPKGFALGSHVESLTVGANNLVANPIVSKIDDIAYDGTAALLSNSELLIPLVKAPKYSFTSSPKDAVLTDAKTWTVGEQGFLAAAFQGLNNARGAWVGSIDLLSQELVSWVFQETGVLKLSHVEHYKQDEPGLSNRTLYRIKDAIYYVAGVSELKNGEWVPYVPPSDEHVLQLSFKMLDPYQRLNMTLLGPGASTEDGPSDLSLFFVEFVAPDHHGMFTFELDYKRPGYTFLLDKKVVAVRHLANDEYKRSWDITNSWMYVTSAGVVVVAWLLFVSSFLFLGVTPAKAEKVEEKAEVKAEVKAEKKAEAKAEKRKEKKKDAE